MNYVSSGDGPSPSNEQAYFRSRETRPVDPNRLRRAAQRGAVRLSAQQFVVEGRHRKEYVVDLADPFPCQCEDAWYHGRNCLHELSAKLASGDGALILMLGEQLLQAEKNLKEHLRQTKRKKR